MLQYDGVASGVTQGEATTDGLITGDRIAVYLQNQSVGKITLGEIRFAGTVYTFVSSASGTLDDHDATHGTGILAGSSQGCMIATASDGTNPAIALQASAAELQPGQQVTLILQLDENVKVGRDAQFKLSTANGAAFVGTIISGQQSG